jgi:hypothetical protein
MSLRCLMPVALVGLFAIVSGAAAAEGARSSPRPLSASAQSTFFHEAVQRTLASKSFTVHSLGPLLIYQAPNRTRVVMIPGTTPFDSGISIVTVGSNAYASLAGTWVKEPMSNSLTASLFLGGRDLAIQYLEPLSKFERATLNGHVFTVHETTSNLPAALQTLIFTTVDNNTRNQLHVATC